MKILQSFDRVIIKYFKNIIVNLCFSALMLLLLYIKLRVANRASVGVCGIFFVCELLSVVLCTVHACIILRVKPKNKTRISVTVVFWSCAYWAISSVVYYICSFGNANAKFVLIIYAVLAIILYGAMITSLCANICDFQKSFFALFFGKIWTIIKLSAYCTVVTAGILIAAVVPVNTSFGRKSVRVVPQEITDKWEPRIFAVVLLFVLPLYTVAYEQMFIAIAESGLES